MTCRRYRLLVVFWLLACLPPLHAQIARSVQTDERQLQMRYIMAQQLERNGQLERAAELYKSICDAQPANQAYYASYIRLLFAQQNYPELERVINQHLLVNPRNESAVIDRGRCLYAKGDTVAAFLAWQQALEQFNYSISIYRTLFNCYATLNLHAAGEKLIAEARQRHQKPDLFALELANYQAIRGNNLAAVQEYLRFGRYNNHNYGMITTQILRLEIQPHRFATLDSLIRLEIEQAPWVVDLHRLRGELLFKFKAYPAAIAETMIIEQLTGNRGDALLKTLQDLTAIQAYAVAESLAATLIGQAQWQVIAPQLLLRLAELAEQQYLAPNRQSPMNYFYPDNLFFNTRFIQRIPSDLTGLQRAFQIYDSLAYRFARSEYTPQALFRLAELRYTVVRDFDGARNLYQQVEKQARDYTLRMKARQRQGELLLAQGAAQAAWDYFEQEAARFEGTDFEKRARLYATLSAFLSGAVDSAYAMAHELVGLLSPADEDFNDLVEFESFLRTNFAAGDQRDQQALAEFARGELLLRQNKLSEAAYYYNFMRQQYPTARCRAAAAFRLMQIALLFNDFAPAETLATELLGSESELGAGALFLLAETADYYHPDLPRAARYYELILEKYPDFLQIAEVRKRLREIYRQLNELRES